MRWAAKPKPRLYKSGETVTIERYLWWPEALEDGYTYWLETVIDTWEADCIDDEFGIPLGIGEYHDNGQWNLIETVVKQPTS